MIYDNKKGLIEIEELLSMKEVQKILKLCRNTIVKEIELGKLKAHKIGKQWRFRVDDLEKYLEALK